MVRLNKFFLTIRGKVKFQRKGRAPFQTRFPKLTSVGGSVILWRLSQWRNVAVITGTVPATCRNSLAPPLITYHLRRWQMSRLDKGRLTSYQR